MSTPGRPKRTGRGRTATGGRPTAGYGTAEPPDGGAARRSGAGLLALLVAGTVAGVLVGVSAEPVGDAARRLAQGVEEFVAGLPVLLAIVREATGLGGPVAAGVVLAVTASALLVHRDRRLAGRVVTAGLGAVVIGTAVSAAVAAFAPRATGVPDGHALASTVAYGLLLLVVAPAMAPGWRRAAAAATVALVVAVGLTRLALGGLPSEVLMGWLLGCAGRPSPSRRSATGAASTCPPRAGRDAPSSRAPDAATGVASHRV
ncbi:MAG: hypothetical protein L0H64_24515, partial [Pseudonocardia sp.]|nr:hypothetical protein [Pseudonocardia sp.]